MLSQTGVVQLLRMVMLYQQLKTVIDMMEKILLINGLIFTYLLFSKKLSSEKKENRKKVKYIGIAVFLIFFIALSSFYFLDNYQMIEIITWGAIIVSSLAILFRIFQLKKENL